MGLIPAAALPLRLGELLSLPGLLTTLIVVAVVILVARVVLRIAWRITLIVGVVAAVLWVLGMLQTVTGALGV